MKTRYAILLAYDGTDFCGWQVQRGVGKHHNPKPSIEGAVVNAIGELCGEEVTVTSSGRTDAGVHASGQVAHFELETTRFSEENLELGLNFRLPDTVRILRLGKAPLGFSAKKAIAKKYTYTFQHGPVCLPHLRNTSLWNRRPLNVDLMVQAVRDLVGTHDFEPFASADATVSSTVRTILEADLVREAIPRPGIYDPDVHFQIRLTLTGTGFLKQMVRRIAGTLRMIGEGQRPPDFIRTKLETKSEELDCPTASASGLCLDQVYYDEWDGLEFLPRIVKPANPE